ncbi:abnormal spindle-like microcephaly-associated protein homolog [Megalobrama amblycephala]|uniref:abnormal spindle-like microcephaly-associated protein homolog n=1 Tax=Megalobrama amblycephala TaxID=75352 RepID=UPI0020144366|nr:abnormal spindle-like microcephaly-associated protein homolog [Megalobrama amblycephala]
MRVKEIICAARRHCFTGAVYHHLCAVRIQRAVRAHWALKSAKKKISSVLYIQGSETNPTSQSQCYRIHSLIHQNQNYNFKIKFKSKYQKVKYLE